MKHLRSYFVVFLMIVLEIVACSSGGGGDSSNPGSSPTPTISSPTPSNPPVSVVTNDTFYVRVYDTGEFTTFMQKRGAAFGTECSIKITDSPQIINCDVRVKELDLFYYGLGFQANVPPGMCDYAVRLPYYYFNHRTGYQGGSVTINLKTSTCSTDINGAAGTFSGGSCIYRDANNNLVWAANSDGTAISYYDYTESYGVNCAEGSYSIYVINPDDSTSSYSGKFSGKYSNCIRGPAVDGIADWPKDKNNWPLAKITKVSSDGFNELWTIQPGNKLQRGTSVQIANGYNYQNLFRAGSAIFSGLPEMIAPSTLSPYSTNEKYFWNCYDRARELKYAINVWVHDFNTTVEYDKWGTTSGFSGASSADPDLVGSEATTPGGTDCKFQDNGGACNDYKDIDDFINSFPNHPD